MAGQHLLLDEGPMGRRMHLWKFGSFGMPVLVFPTAAGFAHEWKQQGMVDALAPLIGAGKIKLYCPESNVAEAWTRKESDPAWRISRHAAYERWIFDVMLPYIREDCRTQNIPIAVAGSSLGGMYAALFALKHPETFHYALCMSGRYEARNFTNGYDSSEIYLNNPLAFVPNLHGVHLQRAMKTRVTLVCGQGLYEEGCIEETRALARVLRAKGIPHREDIWGHDTKHDWSSWRQQARMHLTHEFGR